MSNVPATAPVQTPAAPAKPRFVGIDIVKILACFLVVCVHFFLYSGFYNEPITQEFGQVAIYVRWIAYCCVPLFMITTGYLMKNKTLSKKYYLGILRVLILYLIISVVCYFFDQHHYPYKYDIYGGYSPWVFIRGLFMFTDAQYAWYVEYYVTIFAIIPFLNLAFNSLKNKNQRLILTATVCLLSIVSQSLFIGFNPDSQIRLLPGYFTRCYPIAYYFIGAFIREYPPAPKLINKIYCFIIYAVSLTWLSSSTFQQSITNAEGGGIMKSWHYNDYGSWPVAVCSTALFLILFDIRSNNKVLGKILKFISESTFACYLISYIFDTIFYTTIVGTYPSMQERWSHAPSYIAKIFGCSMLCAMVLQALYNLGNLIVRKIIASKQKRALAAEAAAEIPAEASEALENASEAAEEPAAVSEKSAE